MAVTALTLEPALESGAFRLRANHAHIGRIRRASASFRIRKSSAWSCVSTRNALPDGACDTKCFRHGRKLLLHTFRRRIQLRLPRVHEDCAHRQQPERPAQRIADMPRAEHIDMRQRCKFPLFRGNDFQRQRLVNPKSVQASPGRRSTGRFPGQGRSPSRLHLTAAQHLARPVDGHKFKLPAANGACRSPCCETSMSAPASRGVEPLADCDCDEDSVRE